jgi:hypothetical protein
MPTLIFVPPGHDDIELARCENTDALPRVGDEVLLTMVITVNARLASDPRKTSNANFRVVSVCWDLKNNLITESWMQQKLMYIPGQVAYVYLRVEPLDDATRAYVDRRIQAEQAEAESE